MSSNARATCSYRKIQMSAGTINESRTTEEKELETEMEKQRPMTNKLGAELPYT